MIRPNSFVFYDYTQGDGYIRTFRENSDYALKITDVIITDSLTPYPKSLTVQNDPEAEALLNAVGDVHYERVGHHDEDRFGGLLYAPLKVSVTCDKAITPEIEAGVS